MSILKQIRDKVHYLLKKDRKLALKFITERRFEELSDLISLNIRFSEKNKSLDNPLDEEAKLLEEEELYIYKEIVENYLKQFDNE